MECNFLKLQAINTAWKVSVVGVFLVYIFPHSNGIRRFTDKISVFVPNAGKFKPEKLRPEIRPEQKNSNLKFSGLHIFQRIFLKLTEKLLIVTKSFPLRISWVNATMKSNLFFNDTSKSFSFYLAVPQEGFEIDYSFNLFFGQCFNFLLLRASNWVKSLSWPFRPHPGQGEKFKFFRHFETSLKCYRRFYEDL